MDDRQQPVKNRVQRIVDLDPGAFLQPGQAILLAPERLSIVIDAINLTRELAHAGLKESGGSLASIDGTILDAILGALLVELHALNNGARSTALQPNPSKRRDDGGAQQPDNHHPIDYLLRHEAVGAYEVLRWLGLKQQPSIQFVRVAIRDALGRSTLLAIRKELAEQGKLEDTRNWFFSLAVRPPLPGASAPPNYMATSAVTQRIADRLRFTADRFLEHFPKKSR
ncbi:hypothetical protein [Hyphomonas sp.]|uniref:hypothetical protein n=1 Tax=Hyphomonas sp. TaxID=87 RepID=UPI003F705C76